ncbi:MAG: 2-isopropylmalate synthase [Novibacillus thermophilus]|jgi:2-isopropylmalate synthase|uniref:2-isopropylmalate synthase n=1 Tax=Novibacillus thermophilus TaxID=1471761 RepID=A0A1U9K4F5_9BACL|nr:2-isopropylmalate synthase [Novibacillus thermophilus]AQS54904.1 2-isopropylmalate synthase [Novibacillus thermophilus]
MRKVDIFDTTLRDGEQSPGVNLSQEEKVEIALQLERLGVDVIEAGFAAASRGDFNSVKRVAQTVKRPKVVSLSRTVKKDIDAAWEALKDAENPRLHIFIATSPIHRQYKLRMSKEQVLDNAREALAYAKQFFSEIEFSAEDAGRTELDFLVEVADMAIKSGAIVLNLPDTVGYLSPEEYAHIFKYVSEKVPDIDKITLSAHCHDDLGMAVANSLAAIEAGVGQIEGTINGIGERAGNAAIEEVALALNTRKDYYSAMTGLNLKEIARTSRLVSKLTGMFVPGNKAVVGANAFAHESGIHQDGMLKNSTTYEIMRPETIGLSQSNLVLGKHSGRHAFRDKLRNMGYQLNDEQVNKLFERFKDLADRKKTINDEDLIALVEERWGEPEEVYSLDYFHLSYGTQSVPTATLRLNHKDGKKIEEAACGNGSIDAIYKAIDRATGEQVELADYKINSVTHGKDALGEVFVQLRQNELTVQGRGVSTDILEASARAYIDAVNRLIARRRDQETQKGTALPGQETATIS